MNTEGISPTPALSEEERLNNLRTSLKYTASCVLAMKEDVQKRETDGIENPGEMIANLMLCYRHLEDASMRLGKTLQAKAGGRSVYGGKENKTVVGGPE